MICFAILTLCALMNNLLNAAIRPPDPPVFTAVQHYPCICYLPPDSGLCSVEETRESMDDVEKEDKLLIRYYFDSITEQCYPFGAQDCGGNANRFNNLSQCQNFCRKRK